MASARKRSGSWGFPNAVAWAQVTRVTSRSGWAAPACTDPHGPWPLKAGWSLRLTLALLSPESVPFPRRLYFSRCCPGLGPWLPEVLKGLCLARCRRSLERPKLRLQGGPLRPQTPGLAAGKGSGLQGPRTRRGHWPPHRVHDRSFRRSWPSGATNRPGLPGTVLVLTLKACISGKRPPAPAPSRPKRALGAASAPPARCRHLACDVTGSPSALPASLPELGSHLAPCWVQEGQRHQALWHPRGHGPARSSTVLVRSLPAAGGGGPGATPPGGAAPAQPGSVLEAVPPASRADPWPRPRPLCGLQGLASWQGLSYNYLSSLAEIAATPRTGHRPQIGRGGGCFPDPVSTGQA